MNTGSNSTIRLSVYICPPLEEEQRQNRSIFLLPVILAVHKQKLAFHWGLVVLPTKNGLLLFVLPCLQVCIVVVFVRDICFFADLVNLLDFIVKTFEVLQLKDVLVFLVLSGWLVTLFTSTGTLILAERKKNSEYVLPRIVQQGGLLVIGFLGVVLLIFYFTGGSTSINNALISVYEYVVLENPLTKDERKDVHDSLKYTFMLLIILDFFFICYTAFGLAITRKYQKSWRPTIQTLLEEVIKGSSNL
uniref:Uncharacterized protein n=1 Tax=Ditylenchus dipsaci TaxID=166011 RepID=A0A915DPL3_9BILA